jgi:hypothetical protein
MSTINRPIHVLLEAALLQQRVGEISNFTAYKGVFLHRHLTHSFDDEREPAYDFDLFNKLT